MSTIIGLGNAGCNIAKKMNEQRISEKRLRTLIRESITKLNF